MRDAQIRELDQKGELPIVLLGQVKEPGSRGSLGSSEAARGSSEAARGSGSAAARAPARKAPKRDFRCSAGLHVWHYLVKPCKGPLQLPLHSALPVAVKGSSAFASQPAYLPGKWIAPHLANPGAAHVATHHMAN